jgi:hypothetical protein
MSTIAGLSIGECIPWDELATSYYKNVTSTTGRPTKNARHPGGAQQACIDELRWDAFHEGKDLKEQVKTCRECIEYVKSR